MGKSFFFKLDIKQRGQSLPCAPRAMCAVSVSRLWPKVARFWRNLGGFFAVEKPTLFRLAITRFFPKIFALKSRCSVIKPAEIGSFWT